MNNSKLFNLNLGDLGRGLVVAILSGIALPVLAAIQTPGFSIETANWHYITILAVNGGLAAMAGYLTKNVFTNSEGKFMGKI